jgi:hypothetical protein
MAIRMMELRLFALINSHMVDLAVSVPVYAQSFLLRESFLLSLVPPDKLGSRSERPFGSSRHGARRKGGAYIHFTS